MAGNLLARAGRDAGAVRGDLHGYVAEHFGDPSGVLVVDETGFLNKGAESCAMARQYTGTEGRPESAQVDRAWTLPEEWADDRAGAAGPGCRRASGSSPSRGWPSGCSAGPGDPGCRPGG